MAKVEVTTIKYVTVKNVDDADTLLIPRTKKVTWANIKAAVQYMLKDVGLIEK